MAARARFVPTWAVCFLAILTLASGAACAEQPADTVAVNGRIYTVNPEQPWAEAIAIRGSDIVYVGDNEGAKAFVGEKTRIADLRGKFLMPGIISTHEHPMAMMSFASGLSLEYTEDAGKMLASLKEYVTSRPDASPFSFGGSFEGRVEIYREDIDKIVSDKPFFMVAASGHGGWCNSKALEAAGLTKDTPDPVDSFDRREDGTPSGYVASSAAVVWLINKLGMIRSKGVEASAEGVLQMFAKHGITATFDAGAPFEDAVFPAIEALEKRGELSLRLSASIMTQRDYMTEQAFEKLARYAPKYRSEFFKVETLKVHGDGALDGYTAGLLEPYADKPDTTGLVSFKPDVQRAMTLRAAKLGYDVHTHTIGSRTVRQTLDAYEAVRKAGFDKVHLTTAHTSLVHPDDKPRFKELDVIVNTFGAKNTIPDETTLSRLGKERFHGWGYQPMNSFVQDGVLVTMSADAPTAPLNPFLQIFVTMNRREPGMKESLPPDSERLSLEDAIKAYTINSAKALRWDHILGSIEVGKRADLIVLSRDPFKSKPEEIAEINVLVTMVDGRVVHEEAVDWGMKDPYATLRLDHDSDYGGR